MRKYIDYDELKEICMKINFKDIAGEPIGNEKIKSRHLAGIHYYKDNGSNILAVAHLDSVVYENHFYKMTIAGCDYVYNSRLDNRIGVFIITNLLPKLGLKFDWLLTTDEEIGCSTARDFISKKEYKWAFSFDRAGDDVVMYGFRDTDLVKRLTKSRFKIGVGSFSDICELDDLGCKCINFGSGITQEHSAWANVDITMMISQIRKFLRFYKSNKDIHLLHQASVMNMHIQHYGWDDDWNYNDKFSQAKPSWVPADICSACGKVNTTLRMTRASHADYCDKCCSIMSECASCMAFVPDDALDENGECTVCADQHGTEGNFCYVCSLTIEPYKEKSPFGGICMQCYNDYEMGPKENRNEVK